LSLSPAVVTRTTPFPLSLSLCLLPLPTVLAVGRRAHRLQLAALPVNQQDSVIIRLTVSAYTLRLWLLLNRAEVFFCFCIRSLPQKIRRNWNSSKGTHQRNAVFISMVSRRATRFTKIINYTGTLRLISGCPVD
jgi:hypothetical protein